MIRITIPAFLLLIYSSSYSQDLFVEHFDATSSTSNVEQLPFQDYSFGDPLNAEVLDVPGSRSSAGGGKGDYFFAVYGPRYISGNFDFHAGTDITARVISNGTNHSDTNPPDLICICEGEIVEITTDWEDHHDHTHRGNGNTVKVKCDQNYNTESPNWGNVYLAYRHMSSVAAGLSLGSDVTRGMVLGKMGESGSVGNTHLHFSIQRCGDPDGNCEDGDFEFENVHPMRVFDPARSPHLHSEFNEGDLFAQLLETSANGAIFRTAFLQNQVSIHSIRVVYNGVEHALYEFEEIFENANDVGDLDNPCFADNICVYANPINRYVDAYDRYESFTDGGSDDLPIEFPSNPDYPIVNDFPYNTPAHVLDIVVQNLPTDYDQSLLSIEIRDIFGNGARAIASDKIVKTVQSGDWNSSSTWEGGEIPSATQGVIINHDVTHNSGNVSVKSVVISSNLDTDASLGISGGASLSVDLHFNVYGDNDNRNTWVKIDGNGSSLNVGKDLVIKRYHGADEVYLSIDDNSSLQIAGNLEYIADNYSRNSGNTTSSSSINIGTNAGNPNVNITGNVLIQYGVESVKEIVGLIGKTSTPFNTPVVNVGGNFNLVSNIGEAANTNSGLKVYSNTDLNISGDLKFDYNPSFAESRHEILLTLNDNSDLSVGSLSIESKLNTGGINNLITMNDESRLTVNGEYHPQIVSISNEIKSTKTGVPY